MQQSSYCDSSDHTIVQEPTPVQDQELEKMLICDEDPQFNQLSTKTLKRIAVLSGVKTTISIPHIILLLQKEWMYKKKKRNGEKENVHSSDHIKSVNTIIASDENFIRFSYDNETE